MDEISQARDETSKIIKTIDEIDKGIQLNATSAEELASAAAEMNNQVETLNQHVN